MRTLADAPSALLRSRFGGRVHHFARVDSTNQVARAMGRAGAPDGTVVVADEQTRGRGRRQRTWVSPAGAGLYVSILLRPRGAAGESGVAAQLVAGIAVAECLGKLLPEKPVIRWPNDCYVADRKIAGVLVEAETTGTELDFLVCGIGINVNHRARHFPRQLRGRATSLAQHTGRRVSRLEVLAGLLTTIDCWDDVWRAYGLAPICERWLELSPESVGGQVSVQTDSGLIEGVAEGLGATGHLRVRCADGLRELSSGEVVRLRPA